jgi:perosamine synthetase
MKPIFIAASPNAKSDDVWTAFKMLFTPWLWNSQKLVTKFEDKVKEFMGVKHAVSFDSARSSFYLILKAFGIGEGDEVLLPSFTCVVIVNPVKWVGATPIYVDIDKENFNINFDDLEKKISKRTKAILVQHTFGTPVDMERLMDFAKKHNLKVIEDVAHSIGGTFRNKTLGTFGDAAVMTFGIEKVISTVRGGMVITNDENLAAKLKEEKEKLPGFGFVRTKVSLMNPVIWALAKPLYYVGIGNKTIGRFLIWLSRVFKGTGNMISDVEYKGQKPDWLPARFPGALARLGLQQVKKLKEYNIHRQSVERIYREKLSHIQSENFIGILPPSAHGTVLLRFPILVNEPKKVHELAKKNKMVLGNWYERMFFIPEENLEFVGYKKGSCPNAEWVAKHIVNFPMMWGIDEDEVSRVINLLKS